MITRAENNLRKYFGPELLIKQNINLGKWIFILDGDGIQKSIVHTQPEALIFLFNKECWAAPGRSARTNIAFCRAALAIVSLALAIH